MSSYNGKKLSIEIYGSSRGEKIGIDIDGLAGFSFCEDELKEFLKRRSPSASSFSTARKETDEPVFLEGVIRGGEKSEITGKIRSEIYNKDVKNDDKQKFYGIPRPSHADIARYLKSGELDFAGGGEFSGRMTAMICLAGGICKQILKNRYGINIFAYLTRVGKAKGKGYYDGASITEEFKAGEFPAIHGAEKMIDEIEKAKLEKDSVGAEIECVLKGVPAGLGGALFGGLEGKISNLVYAVPAVKAVEFGLGAGFAYENASLVNDGIYFDEKGKIGFYTNFSGGINGGISNGDDIVLRASFRPAPTIAKPQKTVDLKEKTNIIAMFEGRNDCCVAVRAVPVIEAVAAIAVMDELL